MSNIKTFTSLAAASLLATSVSHAQTLQAKPMNQGYQNTDTQKCAEATCGEAKAKCLKDAKKPNKNASAGCGGKASDAGCGANHKDSSASRGGKTGNGSCGGTQ